MANLYSKATGNWTTLGTFNTLANGTGVDTVPLNTHDVVVQSGHSVTLDATTCVCRSLTVNTGGTLTASTSASNKLTAETDVVIDGTCTLDMSSDVTKTCTIFTNNANGSGSGTISAAGSASPAHNAGGMVFCRYTATITWKGFTRKRWTTTVGAITANSTASFDVTDATGWQIGDRLILATTSAYNATPRVDVITVTGISGNTISGFTGAGTGGTTCAYAHAAGCLIINTTSNVVIGPATANWSGNVVFQHTAAASAAKTINHVQFESLKTCSYFGLVSCAYPFLIAGCDFTDSGWVSFDSNAFYDFRQGNYGMMILAMVSAMTRSNNVHYHPNMTGLASVDFIPAGVITATNYNTGCVFGTESDVVILGSASAGIAGNLSSASILRPKISGMESAIFQQRSFGSHSIVDPDFQSNNNAFRSYFGTLNVSASNSTAAKIGTVTANTNVFKLGSYGSITATLTDCNFQAGGTFISNGTNAPASSNIITLVNGAAGGSSAVTAQEIYHPYGTVKRDNSNNKRSTSSVAIKPSTTGTDTQYTVSVPCANGATVRVIGYVKADTSFYNGGGSNWTAPTVTLSGLGASTQTFTASSAANNAWEQVDLSITNSSGADGNFTLTFTANAKSVTTGTVYFDGMPTSSPFVTKARHYGFLFDQTAPNATENITKSASEATAGAYTGIAVTGGVSTSSTVLSASKTFQQVYDYTQAWSCTTANLDYAIPITGAGAAGTPALFAQGNVTVGTGYALSGSGSINMGSYTLTTETASTQSYTYTGGTWSQATTVPSVSGGTLALSGEGTWTLTATGSPIITFAPTANAVTYAMGASTFGGTVDLRNTHGTRTITVELPSGTTYTTANNTGATITVSTPQVYQSVTVTGAVSGSRIQIYDTTSSTELYNGTPAFPYTWTDPTPASATRAIRLRVAKVSGATAYQFIDANIGTCATSGAGKDVSYLVSQSLDTTYNSNGIDGSTVSDITFTDAATDLVVCNLAGGSTTYPRIYAAFVYWLFTAAGIDDDVTYIEAPDTANYLFTAMKVRNSNATPLTITGGYGRDATSGLVADIIDVAGSTGNIYPQPDHVVAYQTTGTYAITGDISTVLTSIGSVPAAVLTAADASPISANVKEMNGATVVGNGTSGNKWRGG